MISGDYRACLARNPRSGSPYRVEQAFQSQANTSFEQTLLTKSAFVLSDTS